MATKYGNSNQGVYSLGLFTVATPGTVIPLDTNVPITTSWGTPTAGIPAISTSGKPSTMNVNLIKVMAPEANSGDVYLVWKKGKASDAGGTAVILCISPNTEREIQAQNLQSPLQIDQWAIDATNAGDSAYVTVYVS